MRLSLAGWVSLTVLVCATGGCTISSETDSAGDANSANSSESNAVYWTYGVHNPPEGSPCKPPSCLPPRPEGAPPDPQYPPYWQSRWTMYRVHAGYEDFPPPYRGPPPDGTEYERSHGATYYDSTWRGKWGEGAMMEHYEKRCLPIFPYTPNNFTCSFISLGDTAFFLTYDGDRPRGMPPVCLFSPLNHPPRRDFIKHLPYSREDSARAGPGGQAYSFWVVGDPDAPNAGEPIQTGAHPDRTADGAILFGYAFAPVKGKMQPQSFYFSGFPASPPDAPIVAQVYTGFEETKPDPRQTWDKVRKLDPGQIPACKVMQGSPPPAAALKAGKGKRPPTWFDLHEARRSRR